MTSPSTMRLSIVIPCFNEAEALPQLRQRLDHALSDLDDNYEFVIIDDGSSDGSVALIEAWSREDPRVVLVKLSRNFGMEIAMSAGIDHSYGENVVLMHADLQDPPELIPEMLERADAGADVVYARRIGRDESLVKRTLASAFYAMMRQVAKVPYQGQAGDFRLMSRRVVEALKAMPERRRFLRGMVAWVGFEQVPIEYRRAGREKGRGASYPALVRLAVEALAAFSDVPLALASWFGLMVAILSATGVVLILILTAVGAVNASLGVWLLIAVLFLGGVQLVSVGILGRYLARVHAQVLERPLYLVDRVVCSRETASPRDGAGRPDGGVARSGASSPVRG